jgi:hypothetical protein
MPGAIRIGTPAGQAERPARRSVQETTIPTLTLDQQDARFEHADAISTSGQAAKCPITTILADLLAAGA